MLEPHAYENPVSPQSLAVSSAYAAVVLLSTLFSSISVRLPDRSAKHNDPSLLNLMSSILGFSSRPTNLTFRPPLPLNIHGMHPYVSEKEVDDIVESFEQNVNFWYPTMSRRRTVELRQRILSGHLDDSTTSCLAYLVMALGCATQLTCAFADKGASDPIGRYRVMSKLYFDIAFRKIYLAQSECSEEAVQCLFFTA